MNGLWLYAVLTGVIGRQRLQYDLWGHSVNMAARLEAASEPDHLCVREDVAQKIQGHFPDVFAFLPAKMADLKGAA